MVDFRESCDFVGAFSIPFVGFCVCILHASQMYGTIASMGKLEFMKNEFVKNEICEF